MTTATPDIVKENGRFSRKWFYLWHILFWVLYSADELLSLVGLTEPIYFTDYLVQLVPMIAVAYFNLFFLKPKFLDRRQYATYFAVAGGTVLLFPLLHHQLVFWMLGGVDCEECLLPPLAPTSEFLSFYIYTFLEIIFILGLTTAIQLFQDLTAARGRIQSLETKKLQTELDLLKAQINPHFLFNSLNNIHVLTRTDPPQASETILQLSDLLSYQLYECAKDRVLLEKEIEYLRNFLDLHRIRRKNADISFVFEGFANGITIPPLLFIPFVENAVKHGNSVSEEGYIKVVMEVKTTANKGNSGGKVLHFLIENSKGDPLPETPKSGLGLENVKRRLELLYPGRHSLKIEDGAKTFRVALLIEL